MGNSDVTWHVPQRNGEIPGTWLGGQRQAVGRAGEGTSLCWEVEGVKSNYECKRAREISIFIRMK